MTEISETKEVEALEKELAPPPVETEDNILTNAFYLFLFFLAVMLIFWAVTCSPTRSNHRHA
jgi:hypothetical protein